jgi:F0F1-type ATP synthase membrane subunit c/vacuolar-type H+-ATPase subunit K
VPVPLGALVTAIVIGALGAALVEVVYRVARRRGVVFDRE